MCCDLSSPPFFLTLTLTFMPIHLYHLNPCLAPPVHITISHARYQPLTSQTLSPSTTSASLSLPSMMPSSLPNGANYSTPSKHSPLFLHPTILCLHSYLPHAPPTSVTSANLAFRGVSPSPVPSSFSTLSPGSSSSTNILLPGTTDAKGDFAQTNGHDSSDVREVFRWMHLRMLGVYLFPPHPSNKAQAVLGVPAVGTPMVMAANGLVCIGTESGQILVFDFKQTLRCIVEILRQVPFN